MVSHKRTQVVARSSRLEEFAKTIPCSIKTQYFVMAIIRDRLTPYHDTIFVGLSPQYKIQEVNDGRFYVSPCDRPGETFADKFAKILQYYECVKLHLPPPQIIEPVYYGAYADSCEQALELALSWVRNPTLLPKNYDLPIVTGRIFV